MILRSPVNDIRPCAVNKLSKIKTSPVCHGKIIISFFIVSWIRFSIAGSSLRRLRKKHLVENPLHS